MQMWCRGGVKEGKNGGKVVVLVQRWFTSGGALKRCRCRGGGAEVVQRWVVQVQRYRDGAGAECRGGAEVVQRWWCRGDAGAEVQSRCGGCAEGVQRRCRYRGAEEVQV